MGQAYFGDMAAAADFLNPGAIATPMFDSQILDLVRKRGKLGQRINAVPATGQPSRYFEQTRIVEGEFAGVRAMNYNPGGDPTRRERAVTLKAIQASIGFNIFDTEVNQQQGQFTQLVAKDLNDSTEGVLRTADKAIWNGTDTDLVVPATLQFVGFHNQVNRTATIASTASIVDALKAEVASIMADENFDVRPTAIYGNPLALDYIDQEERLNQRQMNSVEVTGGLMVNAISTQAGVLPLIPDPFLTNGPSGGSTSESGKTDYRLAILTESLVEYHYLTSPIPRVFPLGLEGNLASRYMVVMFGAVVFKGKANASTNQGQAEGTQTTYAHCDVTLVR